MLNLIRWGICPFSVSNYLLKNCGSSLKATKTETTCLMTHKSDVEAMNEHKLSQISGDKTVCNYKINILLSLTGFTCSRFW